jgi:hypothetical protein
MAIRLPSRSLVRKVRSVRSISGVKLDMQRAEIEAGKDMTLSTDYPGAGRAVL